MDGHDWPSVLSVKSVVKNSGHYSEKRKGDWYHLPLVTSHSPALRAGYWTSYTSTNAAPPAPFAPLMRALY